MKPFLLILIASLLSLGCAETRKHSRYVSEFDKEVLNQKSSVYLTELESHRDEYGLLLPKEGTQFKDQGDALLWNSIAVATHCLLKENDKAFALWQSVKKLQTSDGRLFRHPILHNGLDRTSVSKDGVIGFLFMGAIIYETSCFPMVLEYGERLEMFSEYVRKHNYEMGVGVTEPSTTFLLDRHLLKSVLKLYDKNHEDMDYKTSLHDLSVSAESAPYIFNNKFICDFASHQKPFCSSLEYVSVFPSHLTFLSVMTSWIDWKHNMNPLHERNDLIQYSDSLARSGVDIGFPNALFITGSEIINESYDFKFAAHQLNTLFPDHLPSEKNGVRQWGCTDYIWQRLPKEPCDQSTTEYLGFDFLLPYALIKYYGDIL